MKKRRDAAISWFERQPVWRLAAMGSAMVVLQWIMGFLRGGARSAILYFDIAVSLAFLLAALIFIARLKTVLAHERELANTDYLTKAANSRYFSEALGREIDRSRRYGHVLTLAYIDIDDFKQVNDRFGHNAGDGLLAAIAGKIKENIRTVDVLARLGGDEFAILFPETDGQGAKIVIDRIRQNIDRTAHGRDWPITMSIGVITCPKVPVSIDKLVALADEAMYTAKQAGKDTVTYREYAT
ncbi:MAG TPA: GGDEF domain-containing protein [Candidatus Omnitrophota bacterium]|nr:GGDEF domain-containing protein [Candidatus Omnitrophota bacterium]